MTRYTLTQEDHAICDQFGELLKRICVGPVSNASASYIKSLGGFYSFSVQDKYRAYSGEGSRKSIALGLVGALDELHSANPSEAERKAKRLAELQAELARLTGEVVAA